MKKIKLHVYLIAFLSILISCSEDNIKIMEDLGEPVYVVPKGEPGSLDELIYNIYERYGTIVQYDFAEEDIRWQWTLNWNYDYIPIKKGNEEYGKMMLEYIQDSLWNNYTDEFVRKYLVYRIYLVDTVYNGSTVVDLYSKENGLIIGNNGPRLKDFTESQWKTILDAMEEDFTLGYYNAAPVKPTQFLSLGLTGPLVANDLLEDPLGEYSNHQYTFYYFGYVKWRNFAHGNANYYIPLEDQDFADYVRFLTKTEATELKHILTRFPKMKERSLVLIPYLRNVIDMDVVATQNKNCPQDPIPADFFDTI